MSFTVFFIIIGIAVIIFSIIHKINKNKRPVKRALISMLSGAAALAAVDILAAFTGVPGVTTLLAVNLFF